MIRHNLPHVTIELRERIPLHDNGVGFTTRRSGTRTASCEVIIDPDKLAYLARRAAASKGHKARIAKGAVTVRVLSWRDDLIKK